MCSYGVINCRHDEPFGTGVGMGPNRFRKFHVVADQQPAADALEIEPDHQGLTWPEMFAVERAEQMRLAVVRKRSAVAVHHLHTVVDISPVEFGVAVDDCDACTSSNLGDGIEDRAVGRFRA